MVDDATGIRFMSSSRMGHDEYRKPKIQRLGNRTVRFYEGGDLRFPDRLDMRVAIVPDDPRSAKEIAEEGRSLASTAFPDDVRITSTGRAVHRPTANEEDAYDDEMTLDLGDGEQHSMLFTVVKCSTGTAILQTGTYGKTPNRRQLEQFHDAFRDGVRCPS